MARQKYRKASEIGEFVYCNRAWWLHHIEGLEGTNRAALDAGRAQHARHGASVRRAAQLKRGALVVIAAAIALLILWQLFLRG